MNDRDILGIVRDLSDAMKKIYGEKLKEVILYGSYARGTADATSDIDLMVLVDVNQAELSSYEDELNDVSTAFALQYLKVFSIIDVSYSEYVFWKNELPFYKNVDKEGVKLYAA